MKVNLPKDNGFQKKTPVLTLVDAESSYRLTKANAVSFDLKVDPDGATSASHKSMVCVLEGNETIRQSRRESRSNWLLQTRSERPMTTAIQTRTVRYNGKGQNE